jgi:hypothetical protein
VAPAALAVVVPAAFLVPSAIIGPAAPKLGRASPEVRLAALSGRPGLAVVALPVAAAAAAAAASPALKLIPFAGELPVGRPFRGLCAKQRLQPGKEALRLGRL